MSTLALWTDTSNAEVCICDVLSSAAEHMLSTLQPRGKPQLCGAAECLRLAWTHGKAQ